jgi:[ribosomal protein S5]-alanine N-acetyltransferase
MHPEPHFEFDGFTVRRGRASDARAVVDYFSRNREHLGPSSPIRAPEFYTEEYWRNAIAAADEGFASDRLAHCFVLAESRVVGAVNLSNFVRGAFHACHLGYSVDAALEGRGVMSRAVRYAVEYAFDVLCMHRVMANSMPENARSETLLGRLGFVREGVAEKCLLIDGEWRDHVLTALVNDSWNPPSLTSTDTHVSLMASERGACFGARHDR